MLLRNIMGGAMFKYEVLAIRRHELGKTQDYIADKIGVTLATYRRWEQGKAVPNLTHLDKIREHLVCSWQYLSGRSDDHRPYTNVSSEELDWLYRRRSRGNIALEESRLWHLLTDGERVDAIKWIRATVAAREKKG